MPASTLYLCMYIYFYHHHPSSTDETSLIHFCCKKRQRTKTKTKEKKNVKKEKEKKTIKSCAMLKSFMNKFFFFLRIFCYFYCFSLIYFSHTKAAAKQNKNCYISFTFHISFVFEMLNEKK